MTEDKTFDQSMTEQDGTIFSQDFAEHKEQLEHVLSSSTWKILTLKLRVRVRIRQLRKLIECLGALWRDPCKLPHRMTLMHEAWYRGGMLALKQLLLQLASDITLSKIWLQYQRTFTPEVESNIRERIRKMENRPMISILMPVNNPPEELLRKSIESVLAQFYQDWELCIVDDASTQSHVHKILREFEAKDSRIRVEYLNIYKGISNATNCALDMAKGKFVALLDHNNILEKQALFRLAESILADNPDMIYSDEAILSENGLEVINHVFRPTFSPEMLRSCPYIVNFVAFRTELLKEIGGLDTSLPISQDYDLILRVSEVARVIVHIPEILYLWRQHNNSGGHKIQAKIMETSRKLLARHLERCGERGDVKDGMLFNFYEVRYPVEPGQRVAIIIPTKNHGELVRQCIESIEQTVKGTQFDILVIDHASTDPETLIYFEQLSSKHRVLRYEGPFNFSVINNWAVKQLDAIYTHYLFCNNDIEATEEGWLERMIELCQKPDVGMVGAKLFYPGSRIYQHAGVCVGMFGIAEHYAKFMSERMPDRSINSGYHGTLIVNHEVSGVTAACALVRSDIFQKIGGFDDSIAVGFGDVDLCLKIIDAGYRILFCPHASLIHHESYTRGKSHEDPHPEDSAFFTKKWRKFLDQGDPYYNANLATHSTKWDIKLPMKFNQNISRRVVHRRSRHYDWCIHKISKSE
ncbi:MAG: glycosyltransferase family 2 protein [Pseudomonadota bacterium]